MELQMSEHEICQMYRDAKDKNEQVKILADLNVCDSGIIIDVLSRNGFVPGLPVKSKTAKTDSKKRKPATQFTAEICAEIEKLYASGMWTGQIAERLGLDYKVVSNKISNMGLPKKYSQNKRNMSSEADKLYIQTLEETLKEKDEALKKVSTNCEAYKIELDKLMQENEYLREQNKYREKFDVEVNALNDAIILLDLLQVVSRQESNSAVFSALFRANEIISGVIKELL